jgi:hypothetical protein
MHPSGTTTSAMNDSDRSLLISGLLLVVLLGIVWLVPRLPA